MDKLKKERLVMERLFYVPDDYSGRSEYPDVDGVVYYYDNGYGPCAVAFSGRRRKPDWRYRFVSEKKRDDKVVQWLEGLRAERQRKAERAAEKKAFRHSLKVGTVLRQSWGYDQTNIDYFEVTKLAGNTMVELRPIASEAEETGFMSGQCVPVPGKYIGDAFRRRVGHGNSVKIFHWGSWAYPCEPVNVVAGAPVYRPDHWTAYA